ncbi:MAG: alpha/beta hydrolase [Planctomycetales bacterium]|nr:alpha/beta hydrolase [Planctomycetales bacterium]
MSVLLWFVAGGNSLTRQVGAQAPAPTRASVIRDEVADVFRVDRGSLLMHLPPTQKSLLALVFTIDAATGQLQPIEQLDAELFEQGLTQGTNLELAEEVWLGPSSAALANLVKLAEPLESDVAARVRLTDITTNSTRLRDGQRLTEQIMASRRIQAAARQGKTLLLGVQVFRARIEFEMRHERFPGSASLASDNFRRLAQPADENVIALKSAGELPFAYVAWRVGYRIDDQSGAMTNVGFVPTELGPATESSWEHAPIMVRAVVGKVAASPNYSYAYSNLQKMEPARLNAVRVEPLPPPEERIEEYAPAPPRTEMRMAPRVLAPRLVETPMAVESIEAAPDSIAYSIAPEEMPEEAPPPSDPPPASDPDPPGADAPASESDVPEPTSAPPNDDGNEVTVLYGTCRAEIVQPADWREFALGFIGTTNGWITVGALAVIGLIVMLVFGFMHRLTFGTAIVLICIGVGLYAGAATVHGFQQVALSKTPQGTFGNKRGDLQFGIAKVSVPKEREKGKLQTPFSVYLIQMPEDPERHFIVTELKKDTDTFLSELKQRVAASDKKDAFVFVHGYNVTFGDAIKRTAQLWVDLEFRGAPLSFTWPSQGELKDYLADSTNAEVAAFQLAKFLKLVDKESGAERIHLIAHSMGNDVLTRALREMKTDLAQPDCHFREILLAAPDVDAQLFQLIVPAIRNDVQHITLYASNNDRALKESYRFRKYPRAGLAGDDLVVIEGVDTIDVSNLGADYLGHSTFGENLTAVNDIGELFKHGTRPPRSGMTQEVKVVQRDGKNVELPYWLFE